MRVAWLLVASSLAQLAACGSGGGDFATDYAAAKANVATLKGGAFAHVVRQRMTTPVLIDAANRCISGGHADRPGYRGVLAFADGGGYSVRFEADDEPSRCLVELYEGRNLPEPPARPYLIPIEAGVAQ